MKFVVMETVGHTRWLFRGWRGIHDAHPSRSYVKFHFMYVDDLAVLNSNHSWSEWMLVPVIIANTTLKWT